MEWPILLSLFFMGLVVLMMLRVPVALAFLLLNMASVTYFVGFDRGMAMLIGSMVDSVARFTFTPIPLFILMGELLYRSGLASRVIDVLNSAMGRVPGRLSVLAITSGTVFATLSGSGLANTTMLGRLLVPEMHSRGYHPKMSIGPVSAAGGLAMLIPPSALMVLLGGIGGISIGALLVAGIVPGLLMAMLFIGYIIVACIRNPNLAPYYEAESVPFVSALRLVVTNVLPLSSIFVVIVGSIIFGIATPTEAAALGAVAAIVLVALYRLLSVRMLRDAFSGTMRINGMIMLIIATAAGYSQMLAFSGASTGMVVAAAGLEIPPLATVAVLLLITLLLGTVLEAVPLMLICLPLFVPVVVAFEFSPVWFGVMFLLAVDIGALTPPIGMLLFVMKGVVPPDIGMDQIIWSVIPFIIREAGLIVLILFIPPLAIWLPELAGLPVR